MKVEGQSPSMNRRQRRAAVARPSRPGRGQHGVALIVVVAVLAFLTAIAVTFFTMTRIELHNASSVRDTMDAEYQAQGALAIAMAFLNHDLAVHSTATSLDHAWRSYFNGAAFVGKGWMFPDLVPLPPLTDGLGVVEKAIPLIRQQDLDALDLTLDQLYIPRFQGNDWLADPAVFTNPFVIPQDYDTLPSRAAVVDLWADVDLDGDGFRDAIWLPMPKERPMDNDGIDNDLDGWIDEGPNMATDGFDNNGDGNVDEPAEDLTLVWQTDGFDNDGDGLIDEGPNADTDGFDNDNDGTVDEGDGSERGDPGGYETMTLEGEYGLFVYWGGNDGLDNDGDGTIDDPIEQRTFLTSPIYYDADLTNDPAIDDGVLLPGFTVRYDAVRVEEYAGLVPAASDFQNPPVDELDNDYSLIINEVGYATYELPGWYSGVYSAWVPVEVWTPGERAALAEFRRGAFNEINVDVYGPGGASVLLRITAAGEPVCDLAGRFAVLITDEASKVDLNATGAYTHDDYWGWDGEVWSWPDPTAPAIRRSIAAGSTPFEYETRVMDGRNFARSIGLAKANHLWSLRAGAHDGIGLGSDPGVSQFYPLDPADSPSDMLDLDIGLPGYGWADDNGNALSLTMNGLDDDGDGLVDEGLNPQYPELLGRVFEGIDEPKELQLHRPLRNMATETDGDDNDGDGALDELGELGDRLFRTADQITLIDGIGGDTLEDLGSYLTVHNAGNNDRYRYYGVFGDELYEDINANGLRDSGENPRPQIAGLKLDYNYASAAQIARFLREEWGYVRANPVGLTPGDDDWYFALGLRQSSVAVEPGANFLDGAATAFARDGILHADQLAVNVKDGADGDHIRTHLTTTEEDDWWTVLTGLPGRAMSYTASGVESIRINEIMVRAVRRVEAEATTNAAVADYNAVNPYAGAFDPNDFSLFAGVRDDFDMRVRTMLTGLGDYNAANGTLWGPVGVPPADWGIVDSGYIGDTAYIQLPAAEPTREFTIDDPAIGAPHLVPHLVEFRFAPSPGLPPGRYYLTVNTSTAGYAEGSTVALGDEDQLRWVAKVDDGLTGIIDDAISMAADFVDPIDPDYVPYRNPEIGFYSMHNPTVDPALDGPTGWSLLHAPQVEPNYPAPRDGYWAGSAAYNAITYTVVVPEYNPAAQEYLYVAVWRGADDTADEIALNFFDFSQEPDHEWVEVVNVAEGDNPDDSIDLSGWTLTVGIAQSEDSVRMRIPDDTYIAPGGSLLLGVNKFDEFDNANPSNPSWPPPLSLICDNGIGLARGQIPTGGGTYPFYENVTVPAIPDLELAWVLTDTGFALDLGPSIFRPVDAGRNPIYEDFIDYDGNSVVDPVNLDTDGDGIPDAIMDSLGRPSSADHLGPGDPNKAWDRIVELEITELRTVTGRSALAAWILKGGIFPNYPEHDATDNDDDSSVLQVDGMDSDGDGDVDEPLVLGADLGEGVDEGRREWWTAAPDFGAAGMAVPGSFSDLLVQHTFPSGPEDASTIPYLGNSAEPPRWKEFVERRMFPGDNVIVSLYQGDPAFGRLVDRVTYTERDVVNRSIDDKRTVPAAIPRLNPAHPTFWPDNTMGVDFYRTLERKHPLYSGDRLGTKNRWDATDGNYDDWDSGQDRWLDGSNDWLTADELIFGHTFSGTPLRMNHFERYTNNPGLMMTGSYPPHIINLLEGQGWRFDRACVPNHDYTSPGSVATLPRMALELQLDDGDPFEIETITRAMLAVDPLLTAPVETRDFDALVTGGAMDPIVLTCGQAAFYPLFPSTTDAIGNDALVEWDFAISRIPQVWSPVFLHPLTALGGDEDPNAMRTIGYFNAPFPAGKYPVFSQLVPDWYDGAGWPTAATADYPIEMNFLFNTPSLPPGIVMGGPGHDLRQRWPLDARAMTYMCANPATFNPVTGADASDALFVWDGTAGLQDGEYEVYVVTAEPLDGLIAADNAARENGGLVLIDEDGDGDNRDDFAYQFVTVTMGPVPEELPVDLEFYTDSFVRDRRCWDDTITPDGLPQPAELAAASEESLGQVQAATPDTAGIIHYGTVKVDNNYLALRITNMAAPGRLNRFSRVVLTPGNRTSGRFNLNTVETRQIASTIPNPLFNPLQGVSGVLGAWSTWDPNALARPFAENAAIDNPGDMTNSVQPFVDGPFYSFDARDDRLGDVGTVNDIMMAREEVYEHEDGRYYNYVSDLYYADVAPGGRQVLSGSAEMDANWGSFTPVEQAQAWFNENATRFSALSNLVTTRSDVFDIIVMAQAGYAVDENRDGVANWRDDNEFNVNAESRLRTKYER
jgi:hypothetical protein